MLIGVMGYKGHGKDTLARIIQERVPSYQVTHWADPLKEICKEVFGLTDYDVHDPIGKEVLFPKGRVFNLDEFVQDLSRATGLRVIPRGYKARSPREILQLVGTEYVRSIQDDYWISKTLGFATRNSDTLVPDTRFSNECQAVRDNGGVLVWVQRSDLAIPTDGHASENSVGPQDADFQVWTSLGDLSNSNYFALALDRGWIR